MSGAAVAAARVQHQAPPPWGQHPARAPWRRHEGGGAPPRTRAPWGLNQDVKAAVVVVVRMQEEEENEDGEEIWNMRTAVGMREVGEAIGHT